MIKAIRIAENSPYCFKGLIKKGYMTNKHLPAPLLLFTIFRSRIREHIRVNLIGQLIYYIYIEKAIDLDLIL